MGDTTQATPPTPTGAAAPPERLRISVFFENRWLLDDKTHRFSEKNLFADVRDEKESKISVVDDISLQRGIQNGTEEPVST